MNVKTVIKSSIYRFLRLLPIHKDEVLIFSYYGEQYSGSPKYIAKYLEGKKDVRVIWAFVNPQKHTGVSSKIVRYGYFNFYKHLATAGTIITNYRMTPDFCKRNGQKYIQTWHSSLRLKMIENDAVDTLPMNYISMAKKDSAQLDYLLAGSQKSKEIFERAFWYNGVIINSGTPQCDIFFTERKLIQSKVFHYFNIPEERHIVLYAPTFRKNHDTAVYDLDTQYLQRTLKKRFGGTWYVLMRLHPHLINQTDIFHYSDTVLQATDYDDVQELLCAADVLISDYSAIMFDYLITNRPCFLYTPDYIEYTRKDRNLYFNIEDLPFEYFENQADMMVAIENFYEKEYDGKVKRFIESIGSYDDGHASERVYKLIKGE